MDQEQIDKIIQNQNEVSEKLDKLLSLFYLEPLSDTTNPILNLSEAAKFLGISPSHLSNACKSNEVPFRTIGSKYIFSKVALLAWLHNINLSFLEMELSKYNSNKNPRYQAYIDNHLKISVNRTTGISEEFQIKYNEPEEEECEKIGTEEAAELLGVTVNKLREWARGFLHYKTPIIREASKLWFPKKELIEWSKTPAFKKLKDEHIAACMLNTARREEAERQRQAEKLEREAKKKARMLAREAKKKLT